MRRFGLTGAVLALALSWPAATYAQVTTAILQGRCLDEAGAAVPGATVSAKNTSTSATRSAVTDANGNYRLAALPVGPYEVSVSLSGFGTQVRSGVTLQIGQEANLDFALKVATVTETITVVGEAPIVETTKTTLGKVITTRQIDDLPISGRNFTNLAFLSPGVLMNTSTGGTTLAAGGGTGRNNAFVIDGLTNDEAAVSATRGEVVPDAIREFQVMSNQFSAEFGQASGLVINVLTRSGGNDVEGRAYFYYRADELSANDPFTQINPATGEADKAPFSQKVVGGFLGGPLKKDKTFFFLSYDHTFRDETAVLTVSDALLRDFGQGPEKTYPQTNRNPRILAKLDHRLTENQTLTLRGRYDDQTQGNQNIGGILTRERGFNILRTDQDYSLAHTWVASPKVVNEARAQFARRFLEWDVEEFCDQCPQITRPSISLGKANNMPQGRTEDRFQFVNTLSFTVLGLGGDHYFKTGLDASFVDMPFFFHSNLDGTFTFNTDRPFNPADRTTYPITYTKNTGTPDLTVSDNIYGAFFQDQWRINPYFTLNLGVRWDYEDSLSTSQDKDNFAPRVHFAWDPTKDGKTAIRGGWGIYYDQVFLNIPLNAELARKFVGTTISNPGYPDPLVGGTISRPPPPSTTVFDPNLETGWSSSFSLGFQREVFRDLAVTLDAVYTEGNAQMITLDTNYSINGSVRPDPNFTRKLQVQSIGRSEYKALQIGVDKRFSNRFAFGLAYTLSDSKRNTEDFNFNPVDHRNFEAEWGPATNDARHTLGGSASAEGPWGVKMGLGGRYRSAQPYNVTTGSDNNRDTFVNDRPEGVGRNSARGASVWVVDARLSKVIRIGQGRVEAIAEAFNLFNHPSHGTFIGNRASPRFGQPTATVANFAARQVQLGLRLDF
jgi:outer membrane receptor for ferrienterochelin and colicin